jgi:hypothetical protein
MEHGKMVIKCVRYGCGRSFEAPTMRTQRFQALFRENGWKQRGSVVGTVYFCPEHGKGR